MRRLVLAAAFAAALAACDGKKPPPPPTGGGGPTADPKALLKAGEDAMRHGDGDAALSSIRAALQADPRYFQAWKRYYELMQDAGKGEDVKAEFEQRLAQSPDDALWLTLAALANSRNREERLRAATTKSPEFVWGHVVFCEALLAAKKPDEAMREAEKALQLAPNEGAVRLRKAMVLYYSGKSTEALAEVDKAKDLMPGDEIVPVLRAQILMDDDRLEEAIVELEKAAQIAPKAQALRETLRKLRLTTAQRALRDFGDAMDANRYGSAVDAAQRASGVLEAQVKETPDDPLVTSKLPIALGGVASALVKRAGESLRNGKEDEATDFAGQAKPWLEKAMSGKLDGDSVEYVAQAWLRLGVLQLSLAEKLKDRGAEAKAKQRFKEAQASFEACLKVDPKSRSAAQFAAEAKKAAGD